MKKRRLFSPLNLILTPLKQHLGCCVVAPLVVKLLGGVALAEMVVKNETVEFLFLLIILPPAVWAILKLEDSWRAWHERKHAQHHDTCDTHCHIEPASFKKRYLVNLACGFALAFLMHLLFHHHG